MSKYVGIKAVLMNSEFKFVEPSNKNVINVDSKDYIIIQEINEDNILMNITRKFDFNPNNESVLYATYRTALKTKEKMTKDEFIKDVKNGLSELLEVFAKLSLTIANMTANSLMGALISPPQYDMKGIVIE